MKVVAKVTVYDRIVEDIVKTRREDREVDYVVVAREEYPELCDDRRGWRCVASLHSFITPHTHGAPMDALTMKTYDFPRTAHGGSCPDLDRYRTYARETFQGIPLLVVPSEFHPR